MEKAKANKFRKLFMLAALSSLLIVAGIIYYSYYSSYKVIKDVLEKQLLTMTRASSAFIDGDALKEIMDIDNNLINRRWRSQFHDLISMNKNLGINEERMHVLMKDPQKPNKYMVHIYTDNKSTENKSTDLGKKYLINTSMKELLEKKSSGHVSSKRKNAFPISDVLYAYAPIYDSQQSVVGVCMTRFNFSYGLFGFNFSIWRWLIVLVCFIVIIGLGLRSFLHYMVALDDSNEMIDVSRKVLSKSEKRFNNLFSHNRDIIFSLDKDFNFLMVSSVIDEHLGLRPKHLIGKNMLNTLLHDDGDFSSVQKEHLKKHLEKCLKEKTAIRFTGEFQHRMAAESKYFKIHLEYIEVDDSPEIFGRASELWGPASLKFFESEKQSLSLDNSLINAGTASHVATRNLIKLLSEEEMNAVRIALREVLINAIEHGNLGITFDDKTNALMMGTYVDLIKSRKQDPKRKEKKVKFDFEISNQQFSVHVKDEGNGFDHKKFIEGHMNEKSNQKMLHGRGLKMILSLFDEVRYNEKGNEVWLRKNLDSSVSFQERIRLKIENRLTTQELRKRNLETRRTAIAKIDIMKNLSKLDIFEVDPPTEKKSEDLFMEIDINQNTVPEEACDGVIEVIDIEKHDA